MFHASFLPIDLRRLKIEVQNAQWYVDTGFQFGSFEKY